ncbi:MAG: hypothetical protein MJE68_23125, partial [Proteobacteria bacterium]|nr:hypothetical protein [Pseudomonadota bacterium]
MSLERGRSASGGRNPGDVEKWRDSDEGRGFVSNVFPVPKKDGGQRPAINLKKLNEYVHTEHFKMEG